MNAPVCVPSVASLDAGFTKYVAPRAVPPWFSSTRAVMEDMLTNDIVFLKKMVDAVDALFRSHGPLQVGHHPIQSQERMVAVVWHCQRFATYQSKENYARLRSSWADLGVRERRLLRKAVHLSEIARNTALLEVTGMSKWNERLFFFRFAGPPSKTLPLCPVRTCPQDPRRERGACRCDVSSMAHMHCM